MIVVCEQTAHWPFFKCEASLWAECRPLNITCSYLRNLTY